MSLVNFVAASNRRKNKVAPTVEKFGKFLGKENNAGQPDFRRKIRSLDNSSLFGAMIAAMGAGMVVSANFEFLAVHDTGRRSDLVRYYAPLMLPMLKLFAEGAPNFAACVPVLQKQFNISYEEASELILSGTTTVLQNRAHWANTYLAKAGLLMSPRRNLHVVTDLGRQVLASQPDRIALASFEGFREWIEPSRQRDGADTGVRRLPSVALQSLPRGSMND